MSVFSDAELTYLAKGKLGRLATIDGAGMPHVVPLGWRYNPGLDVIDAEALADATGPDGQPAGPIIRLHPAEVISWGMEFAEE